MALLLVSLLWALSAQASLPSIKGLDLRSGQSVEWQAGARSVVVFLSPSCPCSRSHEATLAKLAKQYPAFRFLGVVSNRRLNGEIAKPHFVKAQLPFPVVLEEGVTTADAFGALNTPHAFVLDEAGNVLFKGGVDDSRNAGRATQHFLADALQALTEGRPIEVTQARPLGCAIRRNE